MRAASTPGGDRWVRVAVHARALGGRVAARFPLGAQLARYAVVNGAATAANAALFLLVRPFLDAVPANLVALVVTTAASTELNRRFAFGNARAHRLREWVQDLGTVGFYATYTSGVLLALHGLTDAPTPGQEAGAVALASVLGGLLRFLVLRFWVFDLRGHHGDGDGPAADGHGSDRPGGAPPAPTCDGGSARCSTTSPPST